MECMFCQSEINANDILEDGIDARIAGEKTCPLEYNCPECIHVWVTTTCAERFPHDPFFQDPGRRIALSRSIRTLCEGNSDNRLQEPLNLQKLNYLWMKK